MVKCLNINNPIIQEKLNQLTEILGNADAAYAVLALNNGYGLESTPTGERSILFDNILTQIRANNPSADQNLLEREAVRIKALAYSNSFLEEYGDWISNFQREPLVDTLFNKDNAKQLQDIINKAPKDEQGRLLAPNGQLSNLTDKQYAQVRTEEFKNWFGDWENDPENASKVVDENGEPLVVYHHTDNPNLTEFDNDFDNYFSLIKGGTKHAIFFTTNSEKVLNRKYTIPVFLNLKTPFKYNGTKENMHKEGTDYTTLVNNAESVQGAIFTNLDDNKLLDLTVLVAYTPNQIKSATDNVGTFSREDNNIYTHRDNTIQILGLLDRADAAIAASKTGIDWKQTIVRFNKYLTELASNAFPISSRGKGIYKESANYKALMEVLESDKPATSEELNQLFKDLSDKFNKPFFVKKVSEAYLKSKHGNATCYITNNETEDGYIVYVNEKSNPSYTLLAEEMLHPLVLTLQRENPELFTNFLKEAQSGKNKKFKFIADRVKRLYNDKSIQEQNNEIVTQCLAYALKHPNAKKSNVLTKILDAIVNWLNKHRFTSNPIINNLSIDQFANILKYQNVKFYTDKLAHEYEHILQPSVKSYSGNITPSENTIFVFGSNPEGKHGAGAAKVARDKFGAQYGVGEGLTGNAYALPTKDLRVKENNSLRSIPKNAIVNSIRNLYATAKQNPTKQFKVAFRNGLEETTLNGYTGQEMIEMFIEAGLIPENIFFSEEWVNTGKFNGVEIANNSTKSQVSNVTTNTPILSLETKDVLTLMAYLYNKEGLTNDEIRKRQAAYLLGNEDEIQRVKKFFELMQIRQAELHTLQGVAKDFNPERRNGAGVFDWAYYLNNIDLRRSIKATDDLSGFSNIKDYTVDPAEIIMPKLYKTQFKLGRHDIAEIDVDFFKKANPFYKSYLKEQGEKVDFLVRTHTGSFNVIIIDGNFSDIEATKTLRLIQPDIKDGWRVDSNGNRLYKVPEADFLIYSDKYGQETIIIKNLTENDTIKFLNSVKNQVSIQLFTDNIRPTQRLIYAVINLNNIKTNNASLKRIVKENKSDDEVRLELFNIYTKQTKAYKDDLANTLYNSFIRSLHLISVRIPTQDFLSIMATKVVGLTDDEDNNAFVTRWLFWLLGSKQYYL